MQSPIEKFKREVWEEKLEVAKRSLDDEFFHEEYDDETAGDSNNSNDESEKPIITHTLVDLYCSQGHFDKAAEVLRDILKLHPQDKASQIRLAEIENVLEDSKNPNDESGIHVGHEAKQKIERRYHQYLEKIRLQKSQHV